MQTIKTPDGQVFKFPATMSRAQIAEALKRRLGNNTQTNNNQQPPQNQTGYLKGAFINAPVRGAIGIGQGFDARKAASSAAKADFYDVNSIENMKRAAASRMNPQLYQQIFESEEGIEYLQVLAGQGLTPKQMLERIQKRNPELGTDFSENGWSGQITSIFDRYEADKTAKVDEAYIEGEEALSSLAEKEQLKTKFPMSDVGQRGANIYADAPGVMEWAKGAFKDPLASLAFISEVATESAPSIGAGIATGVITKNPRAAAGIMVLSGAPRTYSGEFVEFLRSQDIDTSDPYAIKAAISNDEILAEANKRGFTKAAIVGFFEALGMKAGGGILRQAFAQGATGSGGELVSDVALDGVENIDWKEVVLEGIAELATTPGEYTIIKGRGLFKNGKLMGAEDLSMLPEFEKFAAADVARALDEISKSEGYKLGNVDPSSSKGAKQALEDVRSTNVQVINDLKKILSKKLDPKNAQSLEELLSVFSPATAGIGAGKKKVSQKVTTGQIEALAELVGDTKEGQQLLQELVKSNVITDLFKGGMKGGVSQFTDLMNPLSHTGAVYDPTRWANVFVGGGAAVASKGATLIIPAGGRVVDFFTGRRSKVSKFVKNNKKALGLPDPDGTSVIEEKQKQKAAAKDRRAAIAQIATILDAPKPGFVENILLGTGLDRSGLETVLNNMASDFGSNSDFVALLNDIQKNLDGEGVAYLDNLSEIIPVIGAYAQTYNPDLVTNTPDNPLLKRSFDSPDVQTDMPNMGSGGTNADTSPQFGTPQFTTQENYNRGIEANRVAAETLSLQAQNDKQLSRADKAVVASALDQLQFNLGSNPTVNAQAIFEQAAENVNQDVAVKYIKPYVDRVIRQQRPKGLAAAVDAGVVPDVDTDTVAEPDAQTEVQQPQNDLYNDALNLVNEERKVSTSYLQRKLGIKYSEASDLVERLQAEGIISEANHVGKRTINEEALGQKITNIFNKSKDTPKPRLSMDLNADQQPNVPELWTTPPQAYDSAATSINKNKNPAGYTKLKKQGVFKEGQTVVDIGGGKFDNVVDEMAEEGVTVKVYDPFNRTPEHNAQVASEVADGKADVAVSNNTLNVIQEPENMSRVIQQAHNAIPTGAKAYFTVYEGSKDSVGKETTQGYQRNEPVTSYIPRLEQVFGEGNVERKGDLLIATKQDAPGRPRMQLPLLQQPEIPRGETTNIQMPNTLGSAFDFAKNSNFRTGRDFKLALQEKALEAQNKEDIDLSELSEENSNRLSDYVVADALEALKNNSNAIGWYDRTVTDALNTLGEVYPEILTSPTNKIQFIWALAVTSNGTKVDKNFELAATAYDTLQRTGRFPTDIGIGEAAKAINSGLAQYHTMMDKFARKTNSDEGDHQLLADFMNSQVPVKQIEKEYDVKISGEGKNTLVRGASILGPKIGNGFFSNLYGNFDSLTMDRWLMRTVGRHRGTLVNINQPMVKQKTSEIKTMLKDASPETIKGLRSIFKPSGTKVGKNLNTEQVYQLAARIAKESTSKPWRQSLNNVSEDLRKAGNALAKYLDGQVEAPAGARERDFIRSVFGKALDRLNSEPAVTQASNTGLTMSDLQALLWYPEKRLYDSSKAPEGEESRGYADDEAPDYANAARKLVEARKGSLSGGRLGSAQPAGDGGRGATSPNARLARPPVQADGSGVLSGRSQSRPTERSFVPSTQEVKRAAKPIQTTIEVGKRGGEFENGIKDIEQVKKLAEAIGVTLKLYDDHLRMSVESGMTGDRFLGVYRPEKQRAFAMLPGDTGTEMGTISEFQSYISALHEVAHGINDLSNDAFDAVYGAYSANNALTKKEDFFRRHSFDDEMAKLLIFADSSKHKTAKVRNEIKHLQDKGKFTGGSDVRYAGGANRSEASRSNTEYYKYIRDAAEFSVDPVVFYLHDPKRMKREYPATAKMIQDFFKNSGKINFYTHPLAMAFAVVLAMMMKQEQADEEDRQMPPGALSPQQQMMAPGALTA